MLLVNIRLPPNALTLDISRGRCARVANRFSGRPSSPSGVFDNLFRTSSSGSLTGEIRGDIVISPHRRLYGYPIQSMHDRPLAKGAPDGERTAVSTTRYTR